MCSILELEGAVDERNLLRAISNVVAQAEILRTGYLEVGSGAKRFVVEANAFSPIYKDISSFGVEDQRNLLIKTAVADLSMSDLSVPPLFRASLLKTKRENFLLILSLHHITYDAAAWSILIGRIFSIYRGGTGENSDCQNYSEHVAHQIAERLNLKYQKAESYWTERLSDMPTPFHNAGQNESLSASYSAPKRVRVSAPFSIPAGHLEKLSNLEGAQATPFMALLSTVNITLAFLTRRNDIVVGTPFMNRGPEFSETLGCFVNQIVLRNHVDLDYSFEQMLREVRSSTFDAYSHMPLSLFSVAERLGITLNEFHERAYATMLVIQPDREYGGLEDFASAAGRGSEAVTDYLRKHPELRDQIEACMPQPQRGSSILTVLAQSLARGEPAQGIVTCFRPSVRRPLGMVEYIAATLPQVTEAVLRNSASPLKDVLKAAVGRAPDWDVS